MGTDPLSLPASERFPTGRSFPAAGAVPSVGHGVPAKPETVGREGCERDLSEIRLKKGEPVDRALRRLKKKVDREGTLKEVRNHRHFEKPSERRRRKMKVARFNAMLAARYADL
jgi:small subunit ribosomal protein S21